MKTGLRKANWVKSNALAHTISDSMQELVNEKKKNNTKISLHCIETKNHCKVAECAMRELVRCMP